MVLFKDTSILVTKEGEYCPLFEIAQERGIVKVIETRKETKRKNVVKVTIKRQNVMVSTGVSSSSIN